MDLVHVALAWCGRFASQVISLTVKGADGLTVVQCAFQRKSHPRATPSAWGEKILYLEASKNKILITDKILETTSSWVSRKELRSSSLEHLLVVWCAELSSDGVMKTLPVFSNRIRGTPRRLVPDDEPRELREPRQQPKRIDVRPVHADFPPPISTEPSKPRRVYIRSSVELARYGYTPGCIGYEPAMTQGPSRDHTALQNTRHPHCTSQRRTRQNATSTL